MQFAEMSKNRKNLGAGNVSIHSEGLLLSVLNVGAAISQKSETECRTSLSGHRAGDFLIDQTSPPRATVSIVGQGFYQVVVSHLLEALADYRHCGSRGTCLIDQEVACAM